MVIFIIDNEDQVMATSNKAQANHEHVVRDQSPSERCPWCGASVSRVEFERIRDQIEKQERTRLINLEQTLRQQFSRQQEQAEKTSKAAIEQAKREAMGAAAAQIKAFKTTQDATIAARVQAAREVSERKLADALTREKSQSAEERIKLTEQLAELKRKLENKTADELGSGPELDLFQALSKEFSGMDKVTRVPRGRNGADVIHDICHSGKTVGRIIYDSKAHARWQNRFVAKLREDMIEHRADHGVLSSTVFPAGTRQLHIQDGMIIAAPARVLVLAHLLRRQIVQAHMLRLGNKARDEKKDALYAFLTGDRANQLFEQIIALTDDMLDLDAKETSAHQSTWRRRGDLVRGIQRLSAEFTGEIEEIIGGHAPTVATSSN
jgi:hypothetical protein